MRHLILTQSRPTAHALGAWLELLGERPIGELDYDQRMIVWEGREGLPVAQAFERLARALEEAAYGGGEMPSRHRVAVLVDGVARPDELNVVAQGREWESLLAMLILAFPEFHWVFGVWGALAASDLGKHHSLVSLFGPDEPDPLFDATGLRDWIRERTNHCLEYELQDDLRLPLRREMAAIIEEEQAYLYFNGYCAYRFGFRSDLIASWQRMKNSFGQGGVAHPYWLLLEDMSLNFPDREKGIKLHCLRRERAINCPQLDSLNATVEQSRRRILITTGQTRPGDDTLSQNGDYLREKVRGRGALVLKPASGLFDLWEQAGLMRRYDGILHPDFAPSHRWPPEKPGAAGEADGHGAPGKLLLVAEKLIERAEAIKSQVRSVGDAVLGATLAADALELTGCRTPTSAIQALSLKHQFEVMAECQFSGVEYHIHIEPRISDITRDLEAICLWFGEGKRESARLNAHMHILNQLVRILREYNRFDEEQICMNKVRSLHSTLWMKSRCWRSIFWLPIRYVEYLLGSFLRFVGVLGIWVAVLAFLFALYPADPELSDCGLVRFGIGLENAITSFFSVGAPMQHLKIVDSPSVGFVMVSMISIISGFLHLGVLISHLYSVVSRK